MAQDQVSRAVCRVIAQPKSCVSNQDGTMAACLAVDQHARDGVFIMLARHEACCGGPPPGMLAPSGVPHRRMDYVGPAEDRPLNCKVLG